MYSTSLLDSGVDAQNPFEEDHDVFFGSLYKEANRVFAEEFTVSRNGIVSYVAPLFESEKSFYLVHFFITPQMFSFVESACSFFTVPFSTRRCRYRW